MMTIVKGCLEQLWCPSGFLDIWFDLLDGLEERSLICAGTLKPWWMVFKHLTTSASAPASLPVVGVSLWKASHLFVRHQEEYRSSILLCCREVIKWSAISLYCHLLCAVTFLRIWASCSIRALKRQCSLSKLLFRAFKYYTNIYHMVLLLSEHNECRF